MAVRFAGASGGCGAVLRKTIGMRSALLCTYSAEKLLIMEQCRAVCGPPGIAFSRVGSWRKTAALGIAGSPSQSMPIGLDSSPKGRAFGSPRKLHLFAKASPFGRGVTEGDGEGEAAKKERRRHGKNPLRHRCAMPPPPKGGGFALLAARSRKAPPSGELAATSGSRLRGSAPLDISPLLHYNTSKMNHSKMKG